MGGCNDNNNNNRFFADFSVDFWSINFMPYRFRPLAKVRPKRDVRGEGVKDIG